MAREVTVPLDLSKFEHLYDFTFQTSLGELKAGTVTVGTHKAIHKRFPDLTSADAGDYTRFLASKIAGRESSTDKSIAPLSDDEVERLTADDLNISRLAISFRQIN